jgi:elongation factor Ts
MAIDMNLLKKLREETGAGVMDVRRAIKTAAQKSDREAKEGYVGSYVHTTGKVAAMVALTCETDFVARTEDFKDLAREVAMQVASMNPESVEELLDQAYIRDGKKLIKDLVKETAGKVGENIVVREISRMAI